MVKNSYPSRRQAKKQTNWFLVISGVLTAILLVTAGLYSVFGVSRTVQQTNGSSVTKNSKQITYSTQSKDTKGLPDVSPKDWKLLLVNRDNKSKELNPELANVYGVSVDARIAKNVEEFLVYLFFKRHFFPPFLPQMYHLRLSGAGMCTHKKTHCRRDAGKD